MSKSSPANADSKKPQKQSKAKSENNAEQNAVQDPQVDQAGNQDQPDVSFADLKLSPEILSTLDGLGYTEPSAIQREIIPLMLAGRDVIGQAQTGTGKTAAFALPILDSIDAKLPKPQAIVMAPTRELALQVSEAFKSYSKQLKNIKVMAVYGGQDFKPQLQQLRDGAQIIVGTPGRMMDHIRRGTLKLEDIKHIVLDEADEMLRMGFVDDIEWIMQQLPEERQTALLSATMPRPIRRIAQQYLIEPEEIKIKVKTTTAATIKQRYYYCNRSQKLDSLKRILEGEDFSAVIIFVRTKANTVELCEKLLQIGYSTAALNGDIAQNQREQTVTRIKNGSIDIVVATDVAARGLDVERITHVINYDVPFDAESYVHRIGRTGRAGRTGDAILFVEPREKHMLRTIEKTTNQVIEEMALPSAKEISEKRIAQFKQTITETVEKTSTDELDFYLGIVEGFLEESELELEPLVAALAKMSQGSQSLIVKEQPVHTPREPRGKGRDRNERGRGRDRERGERNSAPRKRRDNSEMDSYRIEVGRSHGVAPKHIVGAICNEANLPSSNVGQIDIHDDFSAIDLPKGMGNDVIAKLKKTHVLGQAMNISKIAGEKPRANKAPGKAPAKRKSNSSGGPSKRAPAKGKTKDGSAPPRKRSAKKSNSED